jgi:DHA2 family multidrug resistance protein
MAEPALADAPAQAAPRPLEGNALAITAVALALGTFMQVLDSTIANVSIPTISGDLGVSVSQGTWVITAFAVAQGISVPLTGWLMQRFGVVKTFIFAVSMFTLASFLCGIAWNLESLVFFRVLQGAMSGPMTPGSQALLLMVFGQRRQATALAIWSMTTLIAPICGPILGGYISDNYSWQWIFLINVPVGITSALLCWQNLASRETPTRKAPIDKTGFTLLVIWVGALQVMLDTGKDLDWFASPAIVTEALIALVFAIAWVIWEINDEHPIVDLSLFKSPNFAIGTAIFCLGYATFFGNALLLPLWLQTQMGYVATWAGLVAAPSGVVAVVATPFVARIMSRVDARWVATASIAAFGASFYMRSDFAPDADFFEIMAPMLVMGVGMSGFFIALVTIVLNGVPQEQVPSATGLTNFVRITAGSFAASLVTTLWDRSASLHQTRLAETAGHIGDPAWTQALDALQRHGATFGEAAAGLMTQIVHQAYFLAAIDLFRISALATFVLIPLVWFTHKAKGAGGGHAAAD